MIKLYFALIGCLIGWPAQADDPDVSGGRLPGTEPLIWDDPLDSRMMRAAHEMIEKKIDEAVSQKPKYWNRDLTDGDAYSRSITPNRERLKVLLGTQPSDPPVNTHVAFDAVETPIQMQRIGDDDLPAEIYRNERIKISRVRWPALDGVFGEGLLLEPIVASHDRPFLASVVVVPDADQHPEQLAGLVGGLPAEHQIARRLAISGARVIVPMLINRDDVGGNEKLNQSNREWIYRQAFQMGRHIIGYEMDKATAAIGWLEKTNLDERPIGVTGWGEGGLLALYVAAIDTRVDAALLSGDWRGRGANWREPIYRNVWSIMQHFDDSDLAMMIAPRTLIVEQSSVPPIDQDRDKAMSGGTDESKATIFDAGEKLKSLNTDWFDAFDAVNSDSDAYRNDSQSAFARALGVSLGDSPVRPAKLGSRDLSKFLADRHRRQLAELDDYTQRLIRDAGAVRNDFYLNQVLPDLASRKWSTEAVHATTPIETFTKHSDHYRSVFADQILGSFGDPLSPMNPRSRFIKQTDTWIAHDVVLDVTPELFAWGILIQPCDLKPGQQRPVVVLQHGRNGLPEKFMDGGYNGIANKLIDEGFILFAPHNLYRGEDDYRWLDRKANAIGKTLFSFLILQHDQITRWLASLPQVDGARIAFYGNSYGGESAVRIPTVITRYALSICASDFNDWNRKVADTHDPHSFMNTIEWEMPYFGMGQKFNYAEMAYLMIPRPFMVERGHHDLVAPDHWVASEYAKVRLVYDQLGIGDRTAITFFQGGHTMRGEATVDFLKRHLGPEQP